MLENDIPLLDERATILVMTLQVKSDVVKVEVDHCLVFVLQRPRLRVRRRQNMHSKKNGSIIMTNFLPERHYMNHGLLRISPREGSVWIDYHTR